MVGPLRQSMLSVLAVALLMAFSGCIGNQTPEAEAALVDALTGSDEADAEESDSAAPAPAVVPAPKKEAPVEVPAPVVAATPPPTPALTPRTSYVLPDGLDTPLLQARRGMDLAFAGAPPATSKSTAQQWPLPPVEEVPEGPELPEVPVPGGLLVDAFKSWTVSLSGGVEYALGCQSDVDCAFFPLPASAPGQEFTIQFGAAVPPVAYFIDFYEGADYIGTFGDTFSSDPIPGFTEAGHGSFTGIVPAGITEFQVYATGGADFVAHLVIGGESSCPSDPYALGSPSNELYVTPFDSVNSGPGSMWLYAPDGSNGEPGLQRNDDTFGTTCATGDVWTI